MLGLDALLNLVGPKIGIAGVGMASWFMPVGTSASASIAQAMGPKQTFLIAISFGLLATTIMYGAMAATTIGNVVSYLTAAAGMWALKQALGSAISTPEAPEKTVQEVVVNTAVQKGADILQGVVEGAKQTVVNTIAEGATSAVRGAVQSQQPVQQTGRLTKPEQPSSVAADWANQFVGAVTTTVTQEVVSKTTGAGKQLADEFLKGETKQGAAEQEAKENAEKERQAALKVARERAEAERRATELAQKQEVEKQAAQKLALERELRAKAEQEEALRKALEEQTQREKAEAEAEAEAKAQQKPVTVAQKSSLADEFNKETKLDIVKEQVKDQVAGTVRDNLREQAIRIVKDHGKQVLVGSAVLVATAGAAYVYRAEIGAAITGAKDAVKALFEPATATELQERAAEKNLDELADEITKVERAINKLKAAYKKYNETPNTWSMWSGNVKRNAKDTLLDFTRIAGFVPGLFENTFFLGEGEPTEEQQEEVDDKLMEELDELSKLTAAQVKEKATSIVEERVEGRIRKLAKLIEEKKPELDKLMEFIGSNKEKQFGLFINACQTNILSGVTPETVVSKLTNREEVHKIAQKVF